MLNVCVIAFSLLLSSVLSAPVKVHEDIITLFNGEDFHILLPSLKLEITFQNKSAPRSPEVVLMRDGVVNNNRSELMDQLSLFVLHSVGEGDEGNYTVKNPGRPDDVRRIRLIVRDCPNDKTIKYGDNFQIQLFGVTPPIILEYKPKAVEANHTAKPALVLLTSTGLAREGYMGRISANERHVTLIAATGADEGSYTVRDTYGEIKLKVCLNVKEHQTFEKLAHGSTLKINLILNSSLIQLYYILNNDPTPHLLLDKGEFTDAQTELGLEGRLSLDGSLVLLDQVKDSDVGQFKVTDILGFLVSTVYLEIQPYKLESLFVAIIALLGLLAFLLLVCLVSCLIKVKKRAKRAAALEKIAQNAGKEDEGEAFRQVVKNITKMSEESKHSQADNTEKSQSTEVDIKGLEVSSKEIGIGNLDTSDSGVGFNTTALPLDTDTEVADLIPDSEVSVSIAPETKPSAPPALEIQPSPVAEPKASPVPETKKTPDLSAESKLDVPKPADVKPSSEPKPGLSPVSKLSPGDGLEAKTPDPPAPSPSPEPKPATPKPTPSPAEAKRSLAPTPEPPKATTPEPVPIANGTPEPDSAPSQDHADLIEGSAPKAAAPKTPEVELKEAKVGVSAEGTVAEESTTT